MSLSDEQIDEIAKHGVLYVFVDGTRREQREVYPICDQAREANRLRTELAAARVDAERYREARNNVGGYVHLLNLMLKPGATGEQLDKMMDRIAESRRNSLAAIDAAREKTK